jgi:hypothetical protein
LRPRCFDKSFFADHYTLLLYLVKCHVIESHETVYQNQNKKNNSVTAAQPTGPSAHELLPVLPETPLTMLFAPFTSSTACANVCGCVGWPGVGWSGSVFWAASSTGSALLRLLLTRRVKRRAVGWSRFCVGARRALSSVALSSVAASSTAFSWLF